MFSISAPVQLHKMAASTRAQPICLKLSATASLFLWIDRRVIQRFCAQVFGIRKGRSRATLFVIGTGLALEKPEGQGYRRPPEGAVRPVVSTRPRQKDAGLPEAKARPTAALISGCAPVLLSLRKFIIGLLLRKVDRALGSR